MSEIRVLLADDHSVLRDGLEAMLHAHPGMAVVGHAQDGREAVRKAIELSPDVTIMDIVMPELDGIEATRQVREHRPQSRVVILSMYSTTEHIFRALQAGAQGYLLKESAGAEVVAAVRSVHAGRRYLSQKITETVVDDYIREHHARSPLEALSPRERQILQGVAEGKSTAEIARALYLSPKTVDTYRSRLMQKLELDSVAGLVRFAIECGLTPP
ncbi:MAG: response regulator transcription factor [Burkholderiales bacterium]|nr:response regulator transcription factor [Burkholderiales bacterium]OJX07384.1 MAG: DNA-binding response regulator [Burkholderiales bacterium 70-64]